MDFQCPGSLLIRSQHPEPGQLSPVTHVDPPTWVAGTQVLSHHPLPPTLEHSRARWAHQG